MKALKVCVIAAMVAVAPVTFVAAQEYPARPITLIVPYPAGGGSDAMARVVADKLSENLGKSVVIDNRGTGGGNVGTRAVAKAAPDGYTLLLGHTGTISVNPSLYTNPGYDPPKDFVAIGTIGSVPLALIVHPSHPAKSVSDLIALAKKEPGKVVMGASAMGTGAHMSAELFKSMANLDVTIVPYRGLAPFLNDILGGHVPVGFSVTPPAFANIQSGNLRALAVTSRERLSIMPEIPTVAEAGLPGFEATVTYGLFAPAGTSKAIIEKINQALAKSVQSPEVGGRIRSEGGTPIVSTPEEYAKSLEHDATKWSTLIKKLNLRVEN